MASVPQPAREPTDPAAGFNSRLLLVAGPTAVGKSEVALRLAEQFGGEIVSVDSMQVYRGLDIGTAKPSAEERARVPHHLIDVADLRQWFDAAAFTRLAHEAVSDIQARGRLPILCGGTGLYFKAFQEGLGTAPPGDPALRVQLKATPLPELLRELEQRDPEMFRHIARDNPRRVVRALEVIRLTGGSFSARRALWAKPGAECSQHVFFLTREADDLRRRIDARVDEMFRRGLVEETRRLFECGLAENPAALQAIGYRQVVEHLRGERSLEATMELVKARTRQFAKRQRTWFTRQVRIVPVAIAPDESSETAAERTAKLAGLRQSDCDRV